MANPAEYLDRYSLITAAMSTWIATQLWDGHEKDCAKYAGGPGPCDCIQAVRALWHKLDGEIERNPPTMPDLMPQMMDMQDRLNVQAYDLKCAREAIDFFRDQLKDLGMSGDPDTPAARRFCAWYDETQ